VKILDIKTCYVKKVYALKLDIFPENFIERISSRTIWSSKAGGPENVLFWNVQVFDIVG
jgi:hypothetical protein